MEPLFRLANLAILPFWALMMLAPWWRGTARIMRSPLVALAPALGYALLVLPDLATILPVVMSPRLDAVRALLGTERGATVGWLHFLAFDLLVGRQVYLDAREREVPAWVSSPVLFVVLMLGPIGYLLHLGVRARFPLSRREKTG
jgi:hypothetical protein